MEKTVQKLYDELLDDLGDYQASGIIPAQKLNEALRRIRQALDELKAHVRKAGFGSQADEIGFFRKDKPLFVAEQLYALDLCMIQTARPGYDTALIRAFLETELRQVMEHFHKYCFLYQYYQFGSTELDNVFFVRGAYPQNILLPDASDPDPEFSTACDHVWARFIANERLKEWLVMELQALDRSETAPKAPASGGETGTNVGAGGQLPLPPGALKWTGETINLVEIAYGIWLTGQLNNGQVSITEIMEYLEVVFRVRIGKPHRRWQSIAGRKRLGYTRFIDEIKAAIEKRVEEELGR